MKMLSFESVFCLLVFPNIALSTGTLATNGSPLEALFLMFFSMPPSRTISWSFTFIIELKLRLAMPGVAYLSSSSVVVNSS